MTNGGSIISYILFEDIKSKSCFVFEISNDFDILLTLKKINLYLKENKNIKKEEVKHSLEKIVDSYGIEGTKTELKKLIDYILTKVYELIG